MDLPTLIRQLDGMGKATAVNCIDLFEATHLIYRLKPFGYGKQVLRGRDKIYLADAALPGSVLLLGRKLLERRDKLGAAVETAFFKHVFTRYYANTPTFSYWRDGRKDLEVDLITEMGDRIVPFEIKYQDRAINQSSLKGLRLFMEERKLEEGYVITQRWSDFGIYPLNSALAGAGAKKLNASAAAIPAPLACYWFSRVG
jgi:predicted AAA+ superfamily ATPase